MEQWRLRQVHLDFHTSPKIKDVGVDFDADDFGRTLAEADVAWVTLFAKCHHGLCYYPSKVGPRHPGLKFDLLGAQIEACRRRGIVTPAYISVHVDQHMGIRRPEWVCRLKDGKLWGPAALEAAWYNLCLNQKEYVDYVEAMTEEVLKRYPVAGIFYDMCYYPPFPGCFCPQCLERLERKGIDRADDAAHWQQEFEITREYTRRLSQAIRKINPKASVFFNGRISSNMRRELDILTHFEIEALPTGGWGYHFFPYEARFCRVFGKPVQGMTGKFHKSWADFGGLKTPDQLGFETGTILAAAAAVSIGDQLHPRGKLDKGTYQVIGEAFRRVKAQEPWCLGAEALAEVAVVCLPETPGGLLPQPNPAAEGAVRMLLELKHQFNLETPDGDFGRYRVLILPDKGAIDAKLRLKLQKFLKEGGSLIFSHQAGLDPGKHDFALTEAGLRYAGGNPHVPCFLRISGELAAGLPETDFVFYGDSSLVEAKRSGRTFGNLLSSYFNRDYNHFTSHKHSPADKIMKNPVAVRTGDVVYFAPEIFTGYRQHAYPVYKTLVANALQMLLPKPLVRWQAPAAMEISLTRQNKPARTNVHLVNYQPQRRHADIEYIEKLWPAKDIDLSIRTGTKPGRVYLAPEGKDLSFKFAAGYTSFVVPEVISHQIVAIE